MCMHRCACVCTYVRKYTYVGTRTSVHVHVGPEAGMGASSLKSIFLFKAGYLS